MIAHPTSTERAWAAGFLDGEGNFRFAPTAGHQNFGQLRAQASQIDPRPLQRLQRAVGGRITGPYPVKPNRSRARGKPHWEWAIGGFEEWQHALCLLWEFLGPVKREQAARAAALAHAYWEVRRAAQA